MTLDDTAKDSPPGDSDHIAAPIPSDLPEDACLTYDPLHSAAAGMMSGAITAARDSNPATSLSMMHIGDTVAASADRGTGVVPQPPVHSGSFQLRKIVGRGGFGEVWEAVQVSLGRTVAVKRLRADVYALADMQETGVLDLEEAFRYEAVTSGHLDHPNIVPIHDLGVDERGRPILAMKLVRGEPWDARIAEDIASLSPGDFLARHIPILIDVTQAVAFAHARGVVHRDIKPSQVMLGRYGEVLLMDWGLALGVGVADATSDAAGAVRGRRFEGSSPAGTPALMAPEQTEATTRRVGTWTDVYLLGGTLYHLLTGTFPHQAANARMAFEMACDGTVEPPALRTPGRDIPADLAALAMKALERVPEERLESAEEFARQLQDYLSGAGRRREAEALAAQAGRQLDAAGGHYRAYADGLAALENARALWPENPAIAALRARALTGYALAALSNGDLVLARVQAERLGDASAAGGALLARIAGAEERARRREGQRRTAIVVSLLFLIALVVGVAKYTIDQREAAGKIRQQRDELEEMFNFMLGDLKTGLEPLGRLDLLDSVARRAVAYLNAGGDDDRTPEGMARRIRALRNIAAVQYAQGEVRAALDSIERAIAIARALVAAEPDSADAARELARSLNHVSDPRADSGNIAGCVDALDEAAAIFARLAAARPDDPEAQADLGETLRSRAERLETIGRSDEADRALAEGLAIFERLADGTAGDVRWQRLLAATYEAEVTLMTRRERTTDALAATERAHAIYERLATADPGNTGLQANLAGTYNALAGSYLETGRPEAALDALHATVAIRTRLSEADPTNLALLGALASAQSNTGVIHLRQAKLDEALASFRDAKGTREEAARLDPTNVAALRGVAQAGQAVAVILKRQGDLAGARTACAEALAILREALGRDADNLDLLQEMNSAERSLADIAQREGSLDEAIAHHLSAADTLGELVARLPGRPHLRADWAWGHVLVGRLEAERGNTARAQELWAKAVTIIEPTAAGSGDVEVLYPYATALLLLGRVGEARPVVEKVLASGVETGSDFLELCREHGFEVFEGGSSTSAIDSAPAEP